MVQANLDCLYSEEKARLKYAHFLEGFKCQIVYEDKKGLNEKKMSQRSTEEKREDREDG